VTPVRDALPCFAHGANTPEPRPYRETARYVGDLLLGGDPATRTEDLALAAVDAIELRDTWRTMYLGAIEQLGEAQRMIRRQRETIDYLMGADRAEAA
jgi:hypothetical protein